MTKLLVATRDRWWCAWRLPGNTCPPIGSDSRIMAESHDLPVQPLYAYRTPLNQVEPRLGMRSTELRVRGGIRVFA